MQTLSQHTNKNPLKSTEELSDLMNAILKKSRQLGATDACVAVNNDRGFSIDVRMNNVETIAFSEERGIGITVYIGQRKGSASSNDTSAESIHKMVAAACDIAAVSAEDPCFGLPDPKLIQHQYQDLDLYHPWNITPQEAIQRAIACETIALQTDKRIMNSDGVNVSTYTGCRGFANTLGFLGVTNSSRHSMSCTLIASQNDKMQRDYAYTTVRHAADMTSAEKLAEKAVERTVARLNSRQIKTQKAPVIFSSRVSSQILSALVGAVNGMNLYRKNSFLLDALGQQIFPEGIRIYEQPHLKRGLGSAPFDNEGLLTRNNVLVADGRLQQYVLGSYSARKLGLQTTANSGGVFNLTIDKTAGGLHDLLKTMHTGLLITDLMGDGGSLLTGDYSQGASGFWIANGEIQYAVEEITIAGNFKNMFRDITAIGDDINPNIATKCGSILIAEMMIGGS